MSAVSRTLEEAVRHHKAGRLGQAERGYRDVLRIDPAHADALNLLGVAAHQRGDHTAAIESIRRAVAARSDVPAWHVNLGAACRAAGRSEEAIACFQEALRLNPQAATAHLNLGMTWESLDQTDRAVEALRRAAECQPDSFQAHLHLGRLLAQKREYARAADSLRAAVAVNPTHPGCRCLLGKALQQQGEFDEAASVLRQATDLFPDSAEIRFTLAQVLFSRRELPAARDACRQGLALKPDSAPNWKMLGCIHHALGETKEAEQAFRRAVQADPDYAPAHFHLGNLYKQLGRCAEAAAEYQAVLKLQPENAAARYELGNTFRQKKAYEQARRSYERVLQLNPADSAALISLGNVFKSMDRIDESAACYRKIIARLPGKPYWRLWLATLCPMVFADNTEIDRYRRRFRAVLDELADRENLLQPAEITGSGCPPPYNLQFHGRDNRSLKEAYAHLFRNFVPDVPPEPRTGKPKIGFVVTNGHEGVFLRYMLGVLQRLDPKQFDLVIFCSPAGRERMRPEITADPTDNSLRLEVVPHSFEPMRDFLAAARCDVLYYWEIGSDVNNYFLPFFRLAPVQCTSAGMLETSGIGQVDYYLSSEFVEPPGGENHYTEKLIRFRSLLSHQPRLQLPERLHAREKFGLTANQHVYFSPHKIQKFHPDLDPLFAEILRRDPRGVIVIPEDISGYAAGNLRARLQKTAADVFSRICFVPYQPLEGYLSLMQTADVLLDPLYYGGGLTAYDGFALNKPVVTLPTQFARGRYCAALYRRLGLEEAIAASQEEYANCALRLGTDGDYREHLSRQIRDRSDALFDDPAVVDEYQRVFERLVQEARTR